MNTVLWVLQIILCIKLIFAASTHGLGQSLPRMQSAQSIGPSGRPLLAGIAIVTLLGAIGLILPAALGVLTWLTPLSAAIMAGWMLAAIVFHIRCREKPKIPVSLALFVIAAFVAYGRWVIAPL